ncbi:hypothetical protein SAMN05421504_108248 [Amycolatopsis xylanica]|uniref:Uncharacterized protein n=1 Tax=Amycolatopsis xylanica TaxID=589385 RepID=A0A1H3PJS8_9PSEU|nr:hypothetical protein [Amycolatopsis xylanica]SDZ01223.1 hypothetical protein SAMN05421504_108248 [Amycolatopsis xylanica]
MLTIWAEPVGDGVPYATEGPTNGGGLLHPWQTDDYSRWVTRAQMREAVERCDPGNMWYYSGIFRGKPVENSAKATAARHGGRTMMSMIEEFGLPTPYYTDYTELAAAFWRRASAGFSEAVRGEVKIIFGDTVRRRSTWERVEYPSLVANPHVTAIFWALPGTPFRPLWTRGQPALPDGLPGEITRQA